MKPLTIAQAVETTGWSQRMLRYLEQAGLVTALRTAGGHRLYGERQIERLRQLKDLLEQFDIGITDLAFEMRMRTEPVLARSIDDWFGAIHRVSESPRAGIYRRLTAETLQRENPSPSNRFTSNPSPQSHDTDDQYEGEHVTSTQNLNRAPLTANSLGSVSDFK